MIDFEDRLKGCIIGLALGDAFGAPIEFFTRGDISKIYGQKITTFVKNDGLFFKNGEFTDDTQMALCIVEAILRDKNINPETIKNNFLTWFNNNPPDVGIHTSKILNKINKNPKNWKYIAKEEWEMENKFKKGGENASNGSLMRCAPIGVFDFNDLDKLIQDSIDISQITHYDPRCTFSNVALNYLISKNMQRPNNVEPTRYIEDLTDIYNLILPYSPSLAELIAKIHKKILKFSEGTSSFDGIASEFYDKGGYVLDTLAISLISFYCTTSYKDALIETVNFGGDTDTNGAVLGALAGGYYGFNALPQEWLFNLKRLDYLAEICKKFYEVIISKKLS